MFGIIWSTIVGIGAMISGVKLFNENRDSYNQSEELDKKRIQQNQIPYQTYRKRKLNGRTIEIDKKTKKQVVRHIINGDDVLTDPYTGKIIRNISEEEREKYFNEEKKKAKPNTVAVRLGKYSRDFKDIKTGEIYHEVYYNIYEHNYNQRKDKNKCGLIYFYINQDGKIICISDKGRENMLKEPPSQKFTTQRVVWPSEEEINEWIKEENELRRKKRKEEC